LERIPRRTLEDRLISGSVENWETGCWEWVRSRDRKGYGKLAMPSGFKRSLGARAHRVSYELFLGPIPKHHHLHHKCRNTSCIRPDHLEPILNPDNVRERNDRYREIRRKDIARHQRSFRGADGLGEDA